MLGHNKPICVLESTRLGGQIILWEKGVRNGEDTPRVSAGVSTADDRTLIPSGRTPEELGREFEPSSQTIRNWVQQAELDSGRRSDGLTTTEQDELRRLRRENRRLKQERKILSKAAAWFAPETGTIPEGSTNS